jgi:glyoxylase-like metal-dependent hydrolase (beta-lactamase superfamily II)
MDESKYKNINGILAIFAQEPNWPSPANIYIIPDENGFSLVDVGCGGASGIAYLQNGLNHWKLKIEQLHTVVLSHAHPDHMGAMWWILESASPEIFIHHLDVGPALDPHKLEETFDIPLAKQRWAASVNDDAFQNFKLLRFFEDSSCTMSAAGNLQEIQEGDILQLGDFEFEIVHTPGHSPGHVSLYESNKQILLAGDLVGKSPAWYVPAAGGVIAYLESLAKLEALNAATLLPAHGVMMNNAKKAIQGIQKKLLKRESFLIEALQGGPKQFMELNQTLIEDALFHFFPGCGIIESHLIKLEKEGIIKRGGQQVSLTINTQRP